MPALRLKITGDVALGGKRPGEEFTVKADDNGIPLDPYWRRRLADEERYGGGHIARATASSPPFASDDFASTEDTPAADAAPRASSRKKG